MLTSGTLSGLQEFLASWIAHDRSKSGHYFTSRVPKMALYGAMISAPLGHVLISLLQKVFQGRKSLKAKIMQILVSNLIVSFPDMERNTTAVLTHADLTHPEQRLPRVHGAHCGCPDSPPGPRDRQGWFLARHEGQLGCLSHLVGLRPAVPSRNHMGALLQHHRLRHRDIHQRAHQEEEACCPEAKALRRRR
jgi:hypothetical protein